MTQTTNNKYKGVTPISKWLAYWDADRGITKDGRTMREFIAMIQEDAYRAGDANGYAEGAAIP